MLHVWCRGNSHTFVSLAWTCQIQKHWRLEEVFWDLTSSGCSWHGEKEDLLWHPDLAVFPSFSSIASHWELACSNGRLSQIMALKLFMPLVFVPSASENKDASLYSKWIMRNSLFFVFFIPSATMLIRGPYSAEPTDHVVSRSPRHSRETSFNMEE